jgi:hypothetical protein
MWLKFGNERKARDIYKREVLSPATGNKQNY